MLEICQYANMERPYENEMAKIKLLIKIRTSSCELISRRVDRNQIHQKRFHQF